MESRNDFALADAAVARHGSRPSAIIPVIQEIQSRRKYIPPETLAYVARRLGVSPAKAYGVATFYETFSFEQKGKHVIRVCDGTACHVRKSVPILNRLRSELGLSETKKTTDDGLFTVETVACLGACGLAPVITVDDVVYPAMTPGAVTDLLARLRRESDEA